MKVTHRRTIKEMEEIGMIGLIMVLAVVAYLVWIFWGRAFYVIGQYRKGGSQFTLPEPMAYEAIYQKLWEGLQYPDNRNLFYDEYGQPAIAGRYGTYTIHMEDTLLTVQAETNGKLNKNMRQTEEAMCLAAYVRKIFEPAAPVSDVQAYAACAAQRLDYQCGADYYSGGLYAVRTVSGAGRYGKGAQCVPVAV